MHQRSLHHNSQLCKLAQELALEWGQALVVALGEAHSSRLPESAHVESFVELELDSALALGPEW